MVNFSRADFVILISIPSAMCACSFFQAEAQADWPTYGNDPGGTRYSTESQINRSNVSESETGVDLSDRCNDTPTQLIRKAAFEATPILVDGKLFLSTPYDHVIALDPAAGTKLWEYDPGVNLNRNFSEVSSRGVSAWRDPRDKTGRALPLAHLHWDDWTRG